jgi:16S rRNA processing protein RimM
MKPVLVGRVAGAFGVRGELRITTYTEDPLAVFRYRDLKREDGGVALTLQAARVAKGGVIARAKEVVDKDQADRLRGLRLFVDRESLPAPDEDEFYLADLIGLAANGVDGEPLGRIKAVHNFGAGDILELDPGEGRPTRLIPFTKAAVPEVKITRDDAPGHVVVIPPREEDGADEGGGDGDGDADE